MTALGSNNKYKYSLFVSVRFGSAIALYGLPTVPLFFNSSLPASSGSQKFQITTSAYQESGLSMLEIMGAAFLRRPSRVPVILPPRIKPLRRAGSYAFWRDAFSWAY